MSSRLKNPRSARSGAGWRAGGLPGVVALVTGLAASGCHPTQPAVGAGQAGALAQDFQLDDVRGGRFQLSEHRGKDVVLLDFWATWCDPCKVELPHLVEIYEKYRGRGLVVAGVSIDGPESIAQVRGDVQQLRITFPVLLDQETRVVAAYNPRRNAPYSVLINRLGRVVSEHEGYTPGDETILAREIERELGQ